MENATAIPGGLAVSMKEGNALSNSIQWSLDFARIRGKGSREMMMTRHVTQDDVPMLQALMREAPQKSGGVEFTIASEPDFFGRARAYERSQILVAEDGGDLAGSAAVAVRTQLVDGVPSRVGYEFQYFTAPHHRRKGVASRLRESVERLLEQDRADYTTAMIADQNEASIRLFEREGFVRHRDLQVTFLMVLDDCPCADDPAVRRATPDDLPAVASLVERTWRDHDLRAPVDAQTLANTISRVPTLSYDRLLVREEGGQITASAGIWDWSAVQKMHIHAVDPAVQAVVPTLRPGRTVRNWGLTPVGYRNPDDLNALLHFICGEAGSAGVDQIALVGEPDADVVRSSPGIAMAQLGVGLYLKPLNGHRPSGEAPVYVDVVDL
jgi:GNAT superfamily N-acetyltransferase